VFTSHPLWTQPSWLDGQAAWVPQSNQNVCHGSFFLEAL